MEISNFRHFFEVALLAFVGLLPIVNPLAGAPVFLLKTRDVDEADRSRLALRVAQYGYILLLASLLVGVYVLDLFGVSVETVRVAGGFVVCAIAWKLLNDDDSPAAHVSDAAQAVPPEDLARRAFYPLTMPLTVGPGSISVAITLGANQPKALRQLLVVVAAQAFGLALVMLVIYFGYRYADRLLARLGRVGTAVVLRLSAFMLLCIGVQIMWNGLYALVEPLLKAAPG